MSEELFPSRDGEPPMVCLNSEHGILGSCLASAKCCDSALERVDDGWFSIGIHRQLFAAIRQLREEGQVPNPISVSEACLAMGAKREALHPAIERIRESGFSWSRIDEYVSSVADAAARRELVRVGLQLELDARDWTIDPGEAAQRTHDRVDRAVSRAAERPVLTMHDVGAYAYREIKESCVKGGLMGPTTGIPKLNKWINGWKPGLLHIVAGRPSMGKSSLLFYSAVETAKSMNRVVLFSVEMSKAQVWARLLSAQTGINTDLIEGDRVPHEFKREFEEGIAVLSGLPINILDDRDITIGDAASYVRQVEKSQGPVAVVMLDHLHEMEIPFGGDERTDQVYTRLCRQSKSSARSLGVPWVMAAQLSRKVEGRPNKRPLLSDLRDSGGIEAVADVVILLYRERYYEMQEMAKGGEFEDNGEGDVELIIAKQRQGPKAVVRVKGYQACCQFDDGCPKPPTDADAPPAYMTRDLYE